MSVGAAPDGVAKASSRPCLSGHVRFRAVSLIRVGYNRSPPLSLASWGLMKPGIFAGVAPSIARVSVRLTIRSQKNTQLAKLEYIVTLNKISG